MQVDLNGVTINSRAADCGFTLDKSSSILNGTINYKPTTPNSRGIIVNNTSKTENGIVTWLSNVNFTGNQNCKQAIRVQENSDLEIAGCTIINTGDENYGVVVSMSNKNTNFDCDVKLSIHSSTIRSYWMPLSKNGNTFGGSYKVVGSTLVATDGPGIYICNYPSADKLANLSVDSSTITGISGIEGKGTDITISGDSVITALGNPPEYEANNNGSTSDGYSVVLSKSSSSNEAGVTKGSITIEDGVFDGPVAVMIDGKPATTPREALTGSNDAYLTIKGGKFIDQGRIMGAALGNFVAPGYVFNPSTGNVYDPNDWWPNRPWYPGPSTPSYTTGLITQNGNIRYRYSNGKYAVNTWETVYGKAYYFDANGNAVKGMQIIDGQVYYFDANCVMQTGWQKINNDYHYFGWGGQMVTGLQTIEKKTYYFNSNGVMQTGWQEINGNIYLFNKDGARYEVKGWKTIDGEKYYFNQNYSVATGRKTINGKNYLFSDTGEMQTGWQTVNKDSYYFGTSGAMVTGLQTIDGQKYYFNNNGVMQTGLIKTSNGKIYQFGPKGAMYKNTGWKVIDGKRYYFGSDNAAYTGKQTINGKLYNFGSNGALITELQTGWIKKNGYWYYNNLNGQSQTGLQRLSYNGETNYYYFDALGRMQTGWEKINGPAGRGWYFFDTSGKLKKDWLKLNNTWYFLGDNGLMKTGWVTDNGKSYYLEPGEGNMLASQWKQIDGQWYYLDSAGEMATGWKYIKTSNERWADKGWFYFGSDGVMWKNTVTPDGYVLGSSGEWF